VAAWPDSSRSTGPSGSTIDELVAERHKPVMHRAAGTSASFTSRTTRRFERPPLTATLITGDAQQVVASADSLADPESLEWYRSAARPAID
jgi:hypothetical protein